MKGICSLVTPYFGYPRIIMLTFGFTGIGRLTHPHIRASNFRYNYSILSYKSLELSLFRPRLSFHPSRTLMSSSSPDEHRWNRVSGMRCGTWFSPLDCSRSLTTITDRDLVLILGGWSSSPILWSDSIHISKWTVSPLPSFHWNRRK